MRWLGGTVAAVVGGAAAGGAASLVTRYRRDLAGARRRLDAVDRQTITTPSGVVEFAQRGDGPPVLVSHGIFHGCDGGLMSVRDLLGDRTVIAPSRFGYLGSDLPAGATPSAQADAFVAVLDHLGIDRVDVVGISAGATAALSMALRHPDRLRHLVVLAGNLPGGSTAVRQPDWARLLYTDVAMWLLSTLTPRLMERLAGVPPGFACSEDDQRFVDELIGSLFPVAQRADGIAFDSFVSNAAVNQLPIGEITVPTLFVHAADDPLASYDAAVAAAGSVPGAGLLTLDTGGHLTLGQTDRVRATIDSFLVAPVAAGGDAPAG